MAPSDFVKQVNREVTVLQADPRRIVSLLQDAADGKADRVNH